MHHNVKFKSESQDFFVRLNQAVSAYFKSNQIERTGNMEMVIKSIFMLSLYFIPYGFIVSGLFTSTAIIISLYVIMGIASAGIGFSIMHDANHGAYSKTRWINNFMGYSLNLLGGHATNWKIQHNVLHHTYTNIYEMDEDISPRGVLRMSPHSPWRWAYRYQHIYSWFFYTLLSLVWVVYKDFERLGKYHRQRLLTKQKTTLAREYTYVIITKLVYIGYIFIIPLMLTSLSFWQVLSGFLIMQGVSGFIMAIIFQPAHVVDGTEYFNPDKDGNLEVNWAVHQVRTTTNFAGKSKIFSWFVGGLNYQIEHHLFPHICHVHYKNIAPLVEKVTKEFGLSYKTKRTFIEALFDHAKLMKKLGSKPREEKVAYVSQ